MCSGRPAVTVVRLLRFRLRRRQCVSPAQRKGVRCRWCSLAWQLATNVL